MNAGVLLIGAGGHAKAAIATAEAAGISIAGIFDDDNAKNGTTLLGYRVISPVPDASWFAERRLPVHIAIGDNAARERMSARIQANWQSLIHPGAYIHSSVTIGTGALICAHAVVHPDAKIGMHAIVNSGSVVEHDCYVGDFAHLAPRSCLAGGARAGKGAFVGIGAVVIPTVSIGDWAIVGAGAAVIADVHNGARVAGVPARDLRST